MGVAVRALQATSLVISPSTSTSALTLRTCESRIRQLVAARTRWLPITCLVPPDTRPGRGVLEAGAGWGVRAQRGWLGQALSILVSAITCGWSSRALLVVKMADVVVAVPGEAAVEVVLPERGSCLQLSWLRLVVGRWGGCRWRPAIPRLHR